MPTVTVGVATATATLLGPVHTVTIGTATATGNSGATSATIGVGTSSPTSYTSSERRGVWEVRLVERTGTVIATIASAVMREYEDRLNDVGSATFTAHTTDPALALMVEWESEVQVWRDGDLRWWGVVVGRRARGSEGVSEVTCLSLEAYYAKRRFGEMRQSPDLLASAGDFESLTTPVGASIACGGSIDPIGNWCVEATSTAGAFVPSTNTPTATKSSVQAAVGTYSAKVVGNATSTVQDQWLGQACVVNVPVITDPGGTLGPPTAAGNVKVRLSCWYMVESMTRAHPDNKGVLLLRTPVDGAQSWDFEYRNVDIDESTPKGVWQRAEVEVDVPPGSWRLSVRLHACQGTIYYDNVRVEWVRGLNFLGVDQALILTRLHGYAQGTWAIQPTMKTSFNIGYDCPDTGITRHRVYSLHERRPVLDAIKEFPNLTNGCDFGVTFTPTTRTFRTFYPTRGSSKPGLPLIYGDTIADYDANRDGTSDASAIAAEGAIIGGDQRETAFAVDQAAFSGLLLEEVVELPGDAHVATLQAQATAALTVGKAQEVLPTLMLSEATRAMIGVLEVGDTVPVLISDGWVQVAESRRIVRMRVDCEADYIAEVDALPASYERVKRPDVVRSVVHWQRLSASQRRTDPRPAPAPREVSVPFSLPGAVAVKRSPPWSAVGMTGLVLMEAYALLDDAGTSTTSINVEHDGTVVGTISMGSGVAYMRCADLTRGIAATGNVVVETTAAGSGAVGLTVILVFKER